MIFAMPKESIIFSESFKFEKVGKAIHIRGLLEDPFLNFMAIDDFNPPTHHCQVFLVSHHHSDHMDGLFEFANAFNHTANQYIYCSPLTAAFLTNSRRFNLNKNKIIPLPLQKPFTVYEVPGESDVNVTCLPAGHCPGSVMFLIEYKGRRILHTGDFRMTLEDFKKSQSILFNKNGTCKKINELYLDTTFALPSAYNEFPSREDSQKLIFEIIEEWLNESQEQTEKKCVLYIPACIGSDFIYENLWKKFRKSIQVHEKDYYNFYSCIEEMNYITSLESFQNNWTIHACNRDSCCKSLAQDPSILVIRPCVLGFIKGAGKNSIVKKYGVPYYTGYDNIIRIFYSSHNSLKDLLDITDALNPDETYCNTKYTNFIQDMDNLFKKNNENNVIDQSFKFIPTSFNDEEVYSRKKELESEISNKLKLF